MLCPLTYNLFYANIVFFVPNVQNKNDNSLLVKKLIDPISVLIVKYQFISFHISHWTPCI